ncbi:MAG: hypothetical protein U1F43_22895 [Myxococcota bacterium]
MLRRVAFVALILMSPEALADTPVLADGALTGACEAAKALDGCPACTCELTTQTSPLPSAVAAAGPATPIPIGAVLEVSGTKPDGEDYHAAHIVLGTAEKLEHIGRAAATHQQGPLVRVSYQVDGAQQVLQWCEGGCMYEAAGVVHPFVVTTLETTSDMDSPKETEVEDRRLLLCFEGLGGLTCASMPLERETRVTMPGKTLEARRKVLSREGYTRSWAFGKAGDVAFGKASGKRAKDLAHPEAHKVPVVTLGGEPDAQPLTR